MEKSVGGKYATKYSQLLLVIMVVYVGWSVVFELIPEPFSTATLLFFGIVWISSPYILYKDIQHVIRNSDWEPSAWYYLIVIPGWIGVAAVGLYLHRRDKYLEKDENEEDPIEQKQERGEMPDSDGNGKEITDTNENISVDDDGDYIERYEGDYETDWDDN